MFMEPLDHVLFRNYLHFLVASGPRRFARELRKLPDFSLETGFSTVLSTCMRFTSGTAVHRARMSDAQEGKHQSWVNFSALEDGNKFAILADFFRKMLDADGGGPQHAEEPFDLVLPSDDAWQAKIYYKLVEKQRAAGALEQAMFRDKEETCPPKLHDWIIRPNKKATQCVQRSKSTLRSSKTFDEVGPITWTVGDIAKAGSILTRPPLPTSFEDEQEMRRVYSLIYDVFRHKNVLAQALSDIGFFLVYPQLELTLPHVWLLLYDLYHRGFKKRETAVAPVAARLFKAAGLSKAERALWECRTKLAAAVSRLRIQHNALSLSDLLPTHLRADKLRTFGSTNPVRCWVNSKKIGSTDELERQIEADLDVRAVGDDESVGPRGYKWDRHCPQMIAFHASLRPALARSDFVKGHKLVVQDRSFCLGPATFFKHVTELELRGSVVQTHVNSPRTTAYLATILSKNDKIKKLMVFSAGQRKTEYENYLHRLGMTNVLIFSDRLIDVSPDANYMEEVVAVFATPPNSYSAVNDPIDLACSRGGDLPMLEVLTEAEENEEGRQRVLQILNEQRRTLRFAMSRPQIQFVLYETHSAVKAENEEMIDRTVKEINKSVKLHHATLQGKLIIPESVKEINNNEGGATVSDAVRLTMDSDDSLFESIPVPETDVFDFSDLPQLCPSDTSCISYTKEGCFLALIQRKQVIRLDNKYMIQMAENRGLFGGASTSSTRSKVSKTPKKKQEKPPTPIVKSKRKTKEPEIARIAAPTHTFLRRVKAADDVEQCRRCREDREETTIYKQWWSETTRHIAALRSNLIRNKVIRPKKRDITAKTVIASFADGSSKVDEIVAKSRGEDCSNVPLFPRLKLTRNTTIGKVQMQLPVTMIKLY